MATKTAPPTDPYDYQRPSIAATRAIVSDDNTVKTNDMAPEYHTPTTHPAHSHMRQQHTKSTNYSQALVDRAIGTTTDSSFSDPKVVSGLAYRGDNADSTSSRPNVLGRQQSWKADDQKRSHMEKMLSSDNTKVGGYTSTSAGKQ